MNNVDLQELAVHQGEPAVSLIVLCGDRWGCITKIDAACSQAAERVIKEFPHSEGEQLAQKLIALRSRIALNVDLHSVGLFVNRAVAWAYNLPFSAQDSLSIGTAFDTRPIVKHLVQGRRYWILVLSHGMPFLFEGYESSIQEVVHRHTHVNGEERYLVEVSGKRKGMHQSVWSKRGYHDTMQSFIKVLDQELGHFIQHDPLPLLCCGDSETINAFVSFSQHRDAIIGIRIVESLPDHEHLERLIWPVFREAYERLKQQDLLQFEKAYAQGQVVTGVIAVWDALVSGSAYALIAAKVKDTDLCLLSRVNELSASEVCIDGEMVGGMQAVLERALHKGVPVRWYEAEEMPVAFFPLAALVRAA